MKLGGDRLRALEALFRSRDPGVRTRTARLVAFMAWVGGLACPEPSP